MYNIENFFLDREERPQSGNIRGQNLVWHFQKTPQWHHDSASERVASLLDVVSCSPSSLHSGYLSQWPLSLRLLLTITSPMSSFYIGIMETSSAFLTSWVFLNSYVTSFQQMSHQWKCPRTGTYEFSLREPPPERKEGKTNKYLASLRDVITKIPSDLFPELKHFLFLTAPNLHI